MRYIQLGIPITITNGEINDVKIVISNPSVFSKPSDHITPKQTTVIEIKTGLIDLKKTNKMMMVMITVNKSKVPNSFFTRELKFYLI